MEHLTKTDVHAELDTQERCVLCGRETEYRRSVPIAMRRYYVEGAGQLCRQCFITLEMERWQKD